MADACRDGRFERFWRAQASSAYRGKDRFHEGPRGAGVDVVRPKKTSAETFETAMFIVIHDHSFGERARRARGHGLDTQLALMSAGRRRDWRSGAEPAPNVARESASKRGRRSQAARTPPGGSPSTPTKGPFGDGRRRGDRRCNAYTRALTPGPAIAAQDLTRKAS